MALEPTQEEEEPLVRALYSSLIICLYRTDGISRRHEKFMIGLDDYVLWMLPTREENPREKKGNENKDQRDGILCNIRKFRRKYPHPFSIFQIRHVPPGSAAEALSAPEEDEATEMGIRSCSSGRESD